MIQLFIWLSVCFLAAIAFQRKPFVILASVLILRLIIPSQGGWLIVGDWEGNAAIHPATILLLVATPLFLLSNMQSVDAELRRWPGVYCSLAGAVTYSAFVAVALSGPSSLVGLTNSLISSIVFFLLVRILGRSYPGLVQSLLKCFLLVACLIAVLVFVQWIVGSQVPWSKLLVNVFGYSRPIGTFDSPLDLAMVSAIAIPLLAGVKRSLFRYPALLLLLTATVLSESRVPTLLALLGAFYLALIATRSIASTIAVAMVAGVGYFVAVSLPILSGLLGRVTGDDGNSSSARSLATEYIFENLRSVLLVGEGWGSSYSLKYNVLNTSLENGYAILAFDIGGILVVTILAVQLRVTLVKGTTRGSWLAGLMFIMSGFAYSGIATMSAISLVGWFVLALSLEGADEHPLAKVSRSKRDGLPKVIAGPAGSRSGSNFILKN